MSRTTVHTPLWVLQLRQEHQIHIDHACHYRWSNNHCDAGTSQPTATTRGARCGWYVPWHVERTHYRSYRNRRADRHVDYWRPERANVRDTLHNLVKEHRAGDLLEDVDSPSGQHRHTPHRGGYWD
ncbi:hypothetical protein ACFVAJ_19035 [Agromyces sp. NPDC057679]|uniref:hypothetical protein n=1 Tax=Agromyces sp. NPDC057679 TaxID=3346207 RepID=UPI00366D1651